ncbi:MAG: hypothetical protein QOH21_1009 [Acidobacteriota bacterium]|jgi:predicted nucleic acid-binding protein|nr:hypothetical protein [Acidobacteriota bacterium]
MSVVVVDASVVIKWFVPENGTEAALRLLDSDHHSWLPTRLITADERLVNALAAFPKVGGYVELLGSF